MGQSISQDNYSEKQTHSTPIGDFTGQILKSSINGEQSAIKFSQIPYAQSPSGSNRWKKPVPLPSDFNYTGDYTNDGKKNYQPAPTFEVSEEEAAKFKAPPIVQIQDTENITYLNIFRPLGEPPKDGWPVFIYIHGGLLQNGDPVKSNPIELFNKSAKENRKFILVIPGYRLNLFGFLSSSYINQTYGANFAFWDQRESIKWVYKNISHFQGNSEQITLGGLSAGAHSSFYQLIYELYHPEELQIIKRVVFFSNSVWAYPKPADDSQYSQIIEKLGIKGNTDEEIFHNLQKVDPKKLVEVIPELSNLTFKPRLDNDFISSSFLLDLQKGVIAAKLKQKDTKIIIGEVSNEGFAYSLRQTPHDLLELSNIIDEHYNEKIIDVIFKHYGINETLTKEKIKHLYGEILGDGQIRYSSRGLLNNLTKYGFPTENIWRYKISYRTKTINEYILDESLGLLHGQDTSIWFYNETTFSKEDSARIWRFLQPYIKFLTFSNATGWENGDITKVNHFTKSGDITYESDEAWEKGIEVVNDVIEAQLQ
ncbi:hypothetical protein WICMUC_002274 [Wickerhamomyces mucosus]|uniref:Carboxylesterase type B domain-containing protein n=1 Tax=Wickerhamomyces mucosus TaxID=1378264 RepID=A0A9P8TDX6_9ASCO|nr:hypothetical protein WICMUC_002274 [Wickerhamomyces mucosus]